MSGKAASTFSAASAKQRPHYAYRSLLESSTYSLFQYPPPVNLFSGNASVSRMYLLFIQDYVCISSPFVPLLFSMSVPHIQGHGNSYPLAPPSTTLTPFLQWRCGCGLLDRDDFARVFAGSNNGSEFQSYHGWHRPRRWRPVTIHSSPSLRWK